MPTMKKLLATIALAILTGMVARALEQQHRRHFGLVAEDVEKVNADLVVRDKEGKPFATIR